jgi:carbon-monoxide dehydrogenase small subunit
VSGRRSAAAAGGASGAGKGRGRAARPAARAGGRRSGKTPGDREDAGRVEIALRLTVNGRLRRLSVPPMKRLLDVLREDMGLPGSKEGCGEGECGACTVLLDGEPVNSCLVAAGQCDGAKIVTVEGLARGGRLSALQRAFVDLGGAQCGICTPGMLVTSYALLRAARGRVPGEDEVREALAGNLCRCTGYQKIVEAVRAAARIRG